MMNNVLKLVSLLFFVPFLSGHYYYAIGDRPSPDWSGNPFSAVKSIIDSDNKQVVLALNPRVHVDAGKCKIGYFYARRANNMGDDEMTDLHRIQYAPGSAAVDYQILDKKSVKKPAIDKKLKALDKSCTLPADLLTKDPTWTHLAVPNYFVVLAAKQKGSYKPMETPPSKFKCIDYKTGKPGSEALTGLCPDFINAAIPHNVPHCRNQPSCEKCVITTGKHKGLLGGGTHKCAWDVLNTVCVRAKKDNPYYVRDAANNCKRLNPDP